MPQMPAVIGTRAGQWVQGAIKKDGKCTVERHAEWQAAKRHYYKTRGLDEI